MKPKKFNRRLSLNKKTICDLSNNQMFTLKGGVDTYPQGACTDLCQTPPVTFTCFPTCISGCEC